jgi:hypothetical protein
MVETRCHLGLAAEPPHHVDREGPEPSDDLERDLPLKVLVQGEIHLSLTSPGQLFEDPVAACDQSAVVLALGTRCTLAEVASLGGRKLHRDQVLVSGEERLVRLKI